MTSADPGPPAPAMRCAVLGSPIAHSLSPVLHRAAYGELGLTWTYDAIEMTQPELEPFLAGLGPRWRGLSLTMPLKRTVVPRLDVADDWVRVSAAANTVVLEGTRLHGFNTDVPGAAAAIRERTDARLDRAVVLGGGATAASVLIALTGLGCSRATLLVRDPRRAEETAAVVRALAGAPDLEVRTLDTPVAAADIVVSTIPATAQTPELVARLASVPVVFEVTYRTWPTPLAAAATDRVLVSGLDLLVHQAALQVELMTGRTAPLAVMRAAGERALTERQGDGA